MLTLLKSVNLLKMNENWKEAFLVLDIEKSGEIFRKRHLV